MGIQRRHTSKYELHRQIQQQKIAIGYLKQRISHLLNLTRRMSIRHASLVDGHVIYKDKEICFFFECEACHKIFTNLEGLLSHVCCVKDKSRHAQNIIDLSDKMAGLTLDTRGGGVTQHQMAPSDSQI